MMAIDAVSRDIYQNHPFLLLPRDALIEIVKRLCDYRLSSGDEIVRFGRVCVLANEISNEPLFARVVRDAKEVSEMFNEVITLSY